MASNGSEIATPRKDELNRKRVEVKDANKKVLKINLASELK
jgi:hypothetical protein